MIARKTRSTVQTDGDGWPSLAAASAELCSRQGDARRGEPGPAAVSGLASRDDPMSGDPGSPPGWEGSTLARRPPA